MAKASITLPSGATAQIEGTVEEVRDLLDFYKESSQGKKVSSLHDDIPAQGAKQNNREIRPDLVHVVRAAKECDEAEIFGLLILDKPNRLNRVLLPLYVVYKYLDNAYGLSSGEVAKITKELGAPVNQPNASLTLSGDAAQLVIGDKVKVKGQLTRYKLSRKGMLHMQSVLKSQ